MEVAAGKLIALKVRGLAVERPCYLLEARGRTQSTATTAFVRMLNAP
jgi:hypothetical protein